MLLRLVINIALVSCMTVVAQPRKAGNSLFFRLTQGDKTTRAEKHPKRVLCLLTGENRDEAGSPATHRSDDPA